MNDPGGVTSLTLSAGYRGGIVVYLNGVEIARRDLPDGPLSATTPGALYPPEAYVDAAGKLIHIKDKQAWQAAEALRNRSLGPMEIPTKLLRKGVNVLAVQIHRSDFHMEAAGRAWEGGRDDIWAHIEFRDLLLSADAAAGAIAESTAGQRNPHYLALAYPGRSGPVNSLDTVVMRQGVQECEARIVIEEALVGGKIGGGLANRCQELLDARADFCRVVQFSHGFGINAPLRATPGAGWRESAARLYRLAGEVRQAAR
ncbi:MAG: hypothetical protein BIFFINMI_00899 [Phycisphaerae bacterium]|nr:hypothetical protein [Phycisphaerae bacterium]